CRRTSSSCSRMSAWRPSAIHRRSLPPTSPPSISGGWRSARLRARRSTDLVRISRSLAPVNRAYGRTTVAQTTTAPQPVTSPISVRQLGAALAAEVTGVDLTRPLDAATVEAIKQAHADFGVLVLPNQTISSEDLKRFGRYFGQLTVHPFSTSAKE